MMKTILITGASRGIGRATAEQLARDGHHVILTARDGRAGEMAVDQIRAAVPKAVVELIELDLASLAAIHQVAAQFLRRDLTLDVLFNCAGVMQQSPSRRLTVDGIEETLAVNAIAPFLLSRLLLPALEKSGAGRIVNVTSRLHMPGSRGAPVDFDFEDPNLTTGYNPSRAYKSSKLAVLWVTYVMANWVRPRPITVNAVCPGFVPTTAAASTKGIMRFFMTHVLSHMPFARSLQQAVDSFEFMATDPSLDGVNGKFYAEKIALQSSPESYDPGRAQHFWQMAESMCAAFLHSDARLFNKRADLAGSLRDRA